MSNISNINKREIGIPIIIVLSLAVILAGCVKPEIITDNGLLNVSAAVTDASAFIQAGCIDTGNGWLNCSSIGLEERFSCESIQVPNDLGGLSPKVPIVECNALVENWTDEETAGIVREGCLQPIYRKYLIIEDGEYRLIGTKDEFINFFAPVESPEEALAFAVALTNSHANYNITIPEDYTTFVSKIRTTYVEKTDAGFNVHLFLSQICGCGNHPYYSVDYTVTQVGWGNITSSEKIFENPAMSNMCID
jgi:hypothetical protein